MSKTLTVEQIEAMDEYQRLIAVKDDLARQFLTLCVQNLDGSVSEVRMECVWQLGIAVAHWIRTHRPRGL